MIPDGVLSAVPISADFVEPNRNRMRPLVDYEMGGAGLQDPTGGLQYQLWTLESDGTDVWISAEHVARVHLFSRPGISRVTLGFDLNMRVHVAFVQNGSSWLWWYDSQAGAMVFTEYPAFSYPTLGTDEKRLTELANSDLIFAYIRADNLCMRVQRDRFQTEYVLHSGDTLELVAIGMNTENRFQFECVRA